MSSAIPFWLPPHLALALWRLSINFKNFVVVVACSAENPFPSYGFALSVITHVSPWCHCLRFLISLGRLASRRRGRRAEQAALVFALRGRQLGPSCQVDKKQRTVHQPSRKPRLKIAKAKKSLRHMCLGHMFSSQSKGNKRKHSLWGPIRWHKSLIWQANLCSLRFLKDSVSFTYGIGHFYPQMYIISSGKYKM